MIKPWGYEIWYAVTELYAGKILHIDRGHRLSLQYHEYKDESCYLLAGRVVLLQGRSTDELGERVITVGSTWRNLPGGGAHDRGGRGLRCARGVDPALG